jgi:hypothetical protein
MRSDLQIQASRANGSNVTNDAPSRPYPHDSPTQGNTSGQGPITEEGKLASSSNALKHGILSEIVVLHGESEEAFQSLAAELFAELQPVTCIEEDLVNTMAVARWRRTRIWQLEKAALEAQMEHEYHLAPAANHPPATLCAVAFRSLSDNSRTLDLIVRYESRYDRQYLRAHKRLLDLRKNPQPTPPTAPEPAATSRGSESNSTDSAKRTQPASNLVPAATSRGAEPNSTDSAKRTQGPLAGPWHQAPSNSGPAATSRGSEPSPLPQFWLPSFIPRRNILNLHPRQPLHLEPPCDGPIFSTSGGTQPA